MQDLGEQNVFVFSESFLNTDMKFGFYFSKNLPGSERVESKTTHLFVKNIAQPKMDCNHLKFCFRRRVMSENFDFIFLFHTLK